AACAGACGALLLRSAPIPADPAREAAPLPRGRFAIPPRHRPGVNPTGWRSSPECATGGETPAAGASPGGADGGPAVLTGTARGSQSPDRAAVPTAAPRDRPRRPGQA